MYLPTGLGLTGPEHRTSTPSSFPLHILPIPPGCPAFDCPPSPRLESETVPALSFRTVTDRAVKSSHRSVSFALIRAG